MLSKQDKAALGWAGALYVPQKHTGMISGEDVKTYQTNIYHRFRAQNTESPSKQQLGAC